LQGLRRRARSRWLNLMYRYRQRLRREIRHDCSLARCGVSGRLVRRTVRDTGLAGNRFRRATLCATFLGNFCQRRLLPSRRCLGRDTLGARSVRSSGRGDCRAPLPVSRKTQRDCSLVRFVPWRIFRYFGPRSGGCGRCFAGPGLRFLESAEARSKRGQQRLPTRTKAFRRQRTSRRSRSSRRPRRRQALRHANRTPPDSRCNRHALDRCRRCAKERGLRVRRLSRMETWLPLGEAHPQEDWNFPQVLPSVPALSPSAVLVEP